MQTVTSQHVRLDEQGIARIGHTTMKVTELVMEQQAHGCSAEELQFQHPYLTMAEVHGALSYYYDHRDELDSQIEQSIRDGDALAPRDPDSPLRRRLRAMGRLR
jgi:uncharacterized protein (DUF433 family)